MEQQRKRKIDDDYSDDNDYKQRRKQPKRLINTMKSMPTQKGIELTTELEKFKKAFNEIYQVHKRYMTEKVAENAKIIRMPQDLENTKKNLEKTTKDLEKTTKDLENTKKDLEDTEEYLGAIMTDLENTKKDLENTNEELKITKNHLASVLDEVEFYKNSDHQMVEDLTEELKRSNQIILNLHQIIQNHMKT
jgi:ABC-type transporter Mla subunit MlaD